MNHTGNWAPDDFKRGYEHVLGQRNALQEVVIRQFYELATHSLCPETFEKFEEVLDELCETKGMDATLATQPPAADGKLREALVKVYTIYCAKVKAEYGKLYRRKGGTLKPEEARYLDLIAEVGTICEAALAQPASGGGE